MKRLLRRLLFELFDMCPKCGGKSWDTEHYNYKKCLNCGVKVNQ